MLPWALPRRASGRRATTEIDGQPHTHADGLWRATTSGSSRVAAVLSKLLLAPFVGVPVIVAALAVF